LEEDTKGAIRIRISKKNRQHYGQKKTYKTKDRVTRTPLKTGDKLRCSGRVSSSWKSWELDSSRTTTNGCHFCRSCIR